MCKTKNIFSLQNQKKIFVRTSTSNAAATVPVLRMGVYPGVPGVLGCPQNCWGTPHAKTAAETLAIVQPVSIDPTLDPGHLSSLPPNQGREGHGLTRPRLVPKLVVAVTPVVVAHVDLARRTLVMRAGRAHFWVYPPSAPSLHFALFRSALCALLATGLLHAGPLAWTVRILALQPLAGVHTAVQGHRGAVRLADVLEV
jgi:hypothetical protein